MYDLGSNNPRAIINYEGVSKRMENGCTLVKTAVLVYGISEPEAEASIQAVTIDPEGAYMAAVNNKGHCYIWSLTGGVTEEPTKLNPKHKIEAHRRYALNCKFSPDSMYLVTSADQSARTWKTADFSLVQELKHENQRWVWDAAFSADSQYIITEEGVKLWRNLTFFVSFPGIALAMANTYISHTAHHEERPEFILYEYMRIRTKKFPWGDGNHSFFHNKELNALPEGYEE
ncbi:target of rapamycin complex subunit LST8-like [Lycorma delicatula]|uniref:target of rapamycin complex subunit LST8-like n=1 Tax=Lycorma delicatula TaxID=130591 RepID=UPI003F5176C5